MAQKCQSLLQMNTSGIGILSKLISTQVTLIFTIYIRHSAKWGGNIGNVFSSL